MTQPVNIHATCIAIGGKGVLLLGASGAGKSDLALRLIDDGARLVADDRCDLSVRGRRLRASAPSSIAGLIELYGIGIIALPHARTTIVTMAVRLAVRGPRLPQPAFYRPPKALGAAQPVPLITLDGRMASAPARIRAALAAFSRGGFRDTFNLK